MAVQLTIPYETLVELVYQLPPEQRDDLLTRLLEQQTTGSARTAEERIALFRSMSIDLGPISPSYSDRREDWYGDDGR